jgi:hypothetical protein
MMQEMKQRVLTFSARRKLREANIYSKLEQLLKPSARKRETSDSETPSQASYISEGSDLPLIMDNSLDHLDATRLVGWSKLLN